MQKCYSVMALRLAWEAEQNNNKETLEEHSGVSATALLFLFQKKIKKNNFSRGRGIRGLGI